MKIDLELGQTNELSLLHIDFSTIHIMLELIFF